MKINYFYKQDNSRKFSKINDSLSVLGYLWYNCKNGVEKSWYDNGIIKCAYMI